MKVVDKKRGMGRLYRRGLYLSPHRDEYIIANLLVPSNPRARNQLTILHGLKNHSNDALEWQPLPNLFRNCAT